MKNFIRAFILSLTCIIVVKAQFNDIKISTNPEDVVENYSFTLSIELLDGEQPVQAIIFYRTFGDIEFTSFDMTIQGNKLVAQFEPSKVISPLIECYVNVINSQGVQKIYPSAVLETKNFIRINVNKKISSVQEIIILSPTADEAFTLEEFFLAFSLIRVSKDVNKNLTKVFINGNDVSSLLIFSDDLVFIPQGKNEFLNLGKNYLSIFLYDFDGKLFKEIDYSFDILSKSQKEELEKIKFKLNGSAELNLANEKLRFGSANYNRLNLSLQGNYGEIYSNAQVYLTNEEKSFLQPQNRFSLQVYNDWAKLNFGDHFPEFPSLILSGKRVRGLSAKLSLGFFNIQTTYGEITRKIEGELISLVRRDSIVLDPNLIPLDSSRFGQPFGIVRLGTYGRKLFAVRPSFGSGENFQFGITYLHSKDDEKSVIFSAKPKENLVLGTDFFLGFDQRRIQLNFQSAFSLLNKDIALGNISDATLDSIANNNNIGIDVSLLRTIRDILGNFITVNQYLSPINPQELPNLAAEGSLSVNYFGNYFKGTYLYRGNEYTSFGQNYIRTDIKGIQLLDRISLFQNRVFLSLSYEKLNDNLQNTKIATTTFNNYEGSLSLYLRNDFPIVNFSYSNFNTKNDIDPSTRDSVRLNNILNENTNVINLSSSYDFNFYRKHKISLGYLNSKRNDNTFRRSSSSFSSLTLSIQTIWDSDLVSFISSNINNSEIINRTFDFFSLTIGGRLSMLENKLLNSVSFAIFSGDFKRNVLDVNSKYQITNNLSSFFNFRYIINSGNLKDESLLNLLLRYEF
ncbi:MAG: hypothetical protein N2043_08190 [Ignavibacterium sp.]|nr:hypothetical protein [Ignavibacterium sp.]